MEEPKRPASTRSGRARRWAWIPIAGVVAVVLGYFLLMPWYWADYSRKVEAAFERGAPMPVYPDWMVPVGRPVMTLMFGCRPYFAYYQFCHERLDAPPSFSWAEFEESGR